MEHPETHQTTADYRPVHYDSPDQKKSMTHPKMSPYLGLLLMLVSHFVIMFAVMYTMVDVWKDVYINLNQFYMTMMMVLPMTVGMLLFMKSMYPNKKLNLILHGVSILGFAAFFYVMRAQSFVGNEQFLKSMIPHHSGAILMCEQAKLTDPEIIKFCDGIIKAQQSEISTMEEMLKRYQ